MRNILVAAVIGIIIALAIWVSWQLNSGKSDDQSAPVIEVVGAAANQTVTVQNYNIRLSPNKNKLAHIDYEVVNAATPIQNPTPTPRPVAIQAQATVIPQTATLVPVPTPTPTTTPAKICGNIQTTSYTVQQNDTLESIAAKYQTDIASMARCDIASGDIRPNNVIHIPANTTVSLSTNSVCTATSTKHIVSKGENVFRIGLRYGVDKDAIRIANNLNTYYLIYPGDVLCIP